MKNLLVFLSLSLIILCVRADENPDKNEPQSSSLIDTAFCYISSNPWNCVRVQAGRQLNYWHHKIENKRAQILAEADEEVKKDGQSRGLKDGEQELPSHIVSTLDRSFNIIGKYIRHRRSLEDKQLDDINDTTSDSIVNDDIGFFDDSDDEEEGKSSPIEARGKETNLDERQNTNLQGFGGYDDDDVTYYGGYKGSKGKGKKGKKGKKGLVKLFMLGSLVKSKIELLLKVLSFKLQIKFLLIAAVNLFINLARFWIELKNKPQKHNYDHEHEDWGSWKRQGANQNQQQEYSGDFAHRIAYNGYPAVSGVTY